MGVNLCGRNIRMAQQHLHHSQIGPVIKQVCRERVPQDMGREWRINSGQDCVFLDEQPKGLSRHGSGARCDKQRWARSLPEQLWTRFSHVARNPVRRLGT